MDAARRGTHTGDPHRGPTQRGPTQGTHTGDPHRGPTQGTHTEGRAPQRTHHRRGGPHRGPTQNTHRQNPLSGSTSCFLASSSRLSSTYTRRRESTRREFFSAPENTRRGHSWVLLRLLILRVCVSTFRRGVRVRLTPITGGGGAITGNIVQYIAQ